MPGQRVPQVGEVWVFAHFKGEQRRRSRVRIDMVTDEDVVFTYLRQGGAQTATTFHAFTLNYDFAEPASAEAVPA